MEKNSELKIKNLTSIDIVELTATPWNIQQWVFLIQRDWLILIEVNSTGEKRSGFHSPWISDPL